jgi:peptide chain release factor 1
MENKKLILSVTKKDLEIQTFTSGGPGGQHQNRVETGVRIIHRESGAVGESRSEKSQHQNKKLAFGKMARSAKFKIWLNKKIQTTPEAENQRSEENFAGGERVRTYHFPQNRITDHRIGVSYRNLDDVLNGDLDEIIISVIKEKTEEK